MPPQLNAPRDSELPPGYDEEDPYENEDLSEYPVWWKENINTHRKHNLRPYRVPRFSDGTIVPKVVNHIERAYDVDIRIRRINSNNEEDWEVWVEDTPLESFSRTREGRGYTIYHIPSDRFIQLISSYLN